MKSSVKIAQLSLIFFLSGIFLSLSTPSLEQKLIGQWELVKLKGSHMSKKDKGERLDFKSDGTIYMLKNTSEKKLEAKFIGKWEVDEESMSLIIFERNGGDEEMDILKLTEKKLILSERKGKEIHLKKVG